jgi:hypothetical protein
MIASTSPFSGRSLTLFPGTVDLESRFESAGRGPAGRVSGELLYRRVFPDVLSPGESLALAARLSGQQWRGRSHDSSQPGQVYHSFRWIKTQVEARGMFVRQLTDLVLNGQYWLKISRNPDQLLHAGYQF